MVKVSVPEFVAGWAECWFGPNAPFAGDDQLLLESTFCIGFSPSCSPTQPRISAPGSSRQPPPQERHRPFAKKPTGSNASGYRSRKQG